MRRPIILLACAVLMAAPSFGHSATFNVSNATELQQALLDAEANGEDDTIQLAAGTYLGTFNFFNTENKDLTLSGAGRESTILDAETSTSPAFGFSSLEGNNSELTFQGLTFKHAQSANGPGFRSNFADETLTIEDCAFTSNTGNLNGGGINLSAQEGNITIARNIIEGNNGDAGGGIAIDHQGSLTSTSVTLSDNLIVDNHSTSSAVADLGGGVYISQGRTTVNIINNTIANNDAQNSGGGLAVRIVQPLGTLNIYNNIFYGNTAVISGDDLYIQESIATMNLFNNHYEDLQEFCSFSCSSLNEGGNIGGDPLFISNADFQLQSTSPAIDAGLTTAPSLPDTDLLGNPRSISGSVDMGAYQSIPTLSASLASDNLGEVAVDSSSSTILTLSNTGNHSLAVRSISLSDADNFSLDLNASTAPCASATPIIPAGGSCTVGITFSPGEAGEQECTITIASDDPDNSSTNLSLRGTGTSSGGDDEVSSGGCSLGQSSATACMPLLFLIILILPRVHAVLNDKFRL